MITDVRGLESRSLTLRGDPESCRVSAVDVRALAAVTEEVAAYLLSRRDLDDGSGRWAAAYGARCRRAIDLADELAGRCRDVATALALARPTCSTVRSATSPRPATWRPSTSC